MSFSFLKKYKNGFEKINYILGKKNRKLLFFFTVLMLINTFFELLSLGAFIPILMIFFDPNILNNEILILLLPSNFLLNKSNLLIFFVLCLSAIYLIKSLFQIYFNYFKFNLISYLQINLINDLYKKYIFQDYIFVTQINAPTIVRNVTGEVNGFITRILMPLTNIVIDLLLVFFIIISLILIEPSGSFIMLFAIIFFSYLFYLVTKRKITSLGKERQIVELSRLKEIQESFKIFREIKLMGLENFFIKKFNLYNTKVYKLFKTEALIVSLPKILFELIIVILFSIIIILFLNMNYGSKEIITIISIFTLAAVKLLPSFNRILLSFQQINFGIPYLNVTYEEFKKYKINLVKNISENIKFYKNITFENLNFKYREKKIFSKINIKINKGDIVYIKGPSGSGKTTFLDLFCGLIKPDEGKVLIDDKDINNNLRVYQNLITYVPQSVYLLDDTIKKNITLGEEIKDIDIERLQKSLQIACLDDFIKSSEDGLDTLVGENGIKLSGGQKQRIGIARGFYKNSDIIILDEATNAIDLATVEKIYKNISDYSKNKTILITSHHDYFNNFFNNKIDIGNIND
tara:strand:+ start:88 stop:1815 length:1728 start_codon:yes stop_codon:yes gene_type:complete